VIYHDGTTVRLGDIVYVPVPGGTALARAVMLGATREHLDLEPDFAGFIHAGDTLSSEAIVLEWIGENPFAHDDPSLAPVGRYVTTVLDEWVVRSAEPTFVECGEHGSRVAAVVCRHMLGEAPRAGFIENSDDPNDLQAWCHACEAMFEAEGDKTEAFRAFNDFAVVCVDCYRECRSRHSLEAH
jgi:hypothetical protein